MRFMACSLFFLLSRTRRGILHAAPQSRDRIKDGVRYDPGSAAHHKSAALRPGNALKYRSHPRHIELRLLAGAIAPQRAVLADRVGALENPVLPRRQAREDFRFHGFRADEAQVRFHAGQAVGRKTGALLEEHADLVPVDVVERKSDKPELFGLLGIQRLADLGLRG